VQNPRGSLTSAVQLIEQSRHGREYLLYIQDPEGWEYSLAPLKFARYNKNFSISQHSTYITHLTCRLDKVMHLQILIDLIDFSDLTSKNMRNSSTTSMGKFWVAKRKRLESGASNSINNAQQITIGRWTVIMPNSLSPSNLLHHWDFGLLSPVMDWSLND